MDIIREAHVIHTENASVQQGVASIVSPGGDRGGQVTRGTQRGRTSVVFLGWSSGGCVVCPRYKDDAKVPYTGLAWMAADAIARFCGLWRYMEGILPIHME